MKNKLLLSILAALGLAGASSQAQTTFVDVANLGDGVSVISSGGTVKVNATILTKNQRWTRDRVYILANNVIVPNGVTLTIEPGTLIRAEQATLGQGVGAEAALTPADPGALVVARGGRLIAAGTADAPIIFTTMDDPNVPGGEATIPPVENVGAGTNQTVTTSTNTATTNRVHTITGSPTVTNYVRVTTTSGGTNNTALTNGEIVSFTNYSFNTLTNWFRINSGVTQFYATSTLVSTFTNLPANRTLRTGGQLANLGATNFAGRYGSYTYTGGSLTAEALNYGAWAASANSAFKHDGKWGGIVLCGNSTITRGYGGTTNALTTAISIPAIDPTTGVVQGTPRGVQLVEGMAGFSDYSWGGGDQVTPPDDSGILRFVSNRYGGYIIAADAELNSFSFYGVGRGTTLEFLEAWNNADDDFEFWGGDVGMRYALSLFCGDDGLDTDQGFLGAIQYYVQVQNNATSESTGATVSGRSTSNYGDSLTENDGPEGANTAVPLSTYILSNATLIGRGYASTASWSGSSPFAGPNFRDNAGARWHNSIIMDNPGGAVLITDRVNPDVTADADSAASGTSIGRYNGARSSGGFDGAGRGIDLVSTNTGSSDAADGRFHSCIFFRNGLANGSAVGVEGKYSSNAAFHTAYTGNAVGWDTATNSELFPGRHDRNGRGASADLDTNRANTATVIAQLTATTNYNQFNVNPGLNTINPYSRLSGLNLRPTENAARSLANSAIPNVRNLNTNATFAGAVLDNAWMKGWTLSDQLGVWAGTQRLPEELRVLANGANAKVLFRATTNIAYVVERSTDNKSFAPVAHVPAGSEGEVEVQDSTPISGTPLFYRVIAL